jgi:hypothetical protein
VILVVGIRWERSGSDGEVSTVFGEMEWSIEVAWFCSKSVGLVLCFWWGLDGW